MKTAAVSYYLCRHTQDPTEQLEQWLPTFFLRVLVYGMCHRSIPLSPTCLRLCLHLHHATEFWACFSFFVGALERSNADVKYEESSNYTQVSFVFGCNLVFCEEKSCTFVLRYLKNLHGNLAEVKDSLKSPCWQIRFLLITVLFLKIHKFKWNVIFLDCKGKVQHA